MMARRLDGPYSKIRKIGTDATVLSLASLDGYLGADRSFPIEAYCILTRRRLGRAEEEEPRSGPRNDE